MRIRVILRAAIILMLLAIANIGSAGDTYCLEIKSKGEGHWPIAEAAFTKERYEEAVKFLSEAPINLKQGMDYVSVETELVYVQGFLLRSSIVEGNPNTIKPFCEFIENEAYVRH